MQVEPDIKRQIIYNYPGLEFKELNGRETIEGIFGFNATFSKSANQYIINPQVDDDYSIIDEYQIKIELAEGEFPVVYETGNRIPEASDYHKNPDNSLCLAGPFDYINDLYLDRFLDTLLLQFLYDQSFKEKFGYWPRGEYSHGPLGLVENYYDRMSQIPKLEERCFALLLKNKEKPEYQPYLKLIASKKHVKGHHQCFCGSGVQFRKCHEKAFRGLWNLQNFINQNQNKLN